jgi:hypothetical protein
MATKKAIKSDPRKIIDPYAAGMIKDRLFISAKASLEGKVVAVLNSVREGRGLQLIVPKTRCFKQYEVHELILTDEENARPGFEVNRVAGIAFVEFTKGGVLAEGEQVTIGKQAIGRIAGFDETHFPNHINIILKGPKRQTGEALGITPGQKVVIKPENSLT